MSGNIVKELLDGMAELESEVLRYQESKVLVKKDKESLSGMLDEFVAKCERIKEMLKDTQTNRI